MPVKILSGGGKSTKDATAIPGDVRSGKTFYGAEGKQTGIWTPKVTDYITDATLQPEQAPAGEVFYNNLGRQVGEKEFLDLPPEFFKDVIKQSWYLEKDKSYSTSYTTFWSDTQVYNWNIDSNKWANGVYYGQGNDFAYIWGNGYSAINYRSGYPILVGVNGHYRLWGDRAKDESLGIGLYRFSYNDEFGMPDISEYDDIFFIHSREGTNPYSIRWYIGTGAKTWQIKPRENVNIEVWWKPF